MTAIELPVPPEPASASQPIGLCLDCGYALRGLPTPRCPECGREFDPLDPATMNMGRELSSLAKWVLGPIRWEVNLMSWGALVFAIWSARQPGEELARSGGWLILVGLATLWLAWPLVRVIAARKYGWPHSLLMQGQKLRVTVGLCFVLTAAAVHYSLPLKAAVKFSRPAMDKLAADLIASGQPYADDQWVGVYHARRIKVIPGGVRFTVEEQNRAYKSGFTYLPKVNPKTVGWRNKNYRYLGDGWWAWREEG